MAIDKTLTDTFGTDSVEYKRYASIKHLGRRRSVMFDEYESVSEHHRELREDIDQAIAIIEGIIAGFQEDIEHSGSTIHVPTVVQRSPPNANKKVFVVHGHDDAAKEAVARFLQALGLDPIILHEQVSRSRTVIEKIEANSDVEFAVVILTGDDVGGKDGEDLRPRARQNVIFELGYFFGHLKRARVCALKRGDIEVLSDISGVVYTEFDPKGAWKMELAREIKAAGITVDPNALLA